MNDLNFIVDPLIPQTPNAVFAKWITALFPDQNAGSIILNASNTRYEKKKQYWNLKK